MFDAPRARASSGYRARASASQRRPARRAPRRLGGRAAAARSCETHGGRIARGKHPPSKKTGKCTAKAVLA
eukprot:5728778-Pleurochrysis_carterae.AAC.2